MRLGLGLGVKNSGFVGGYDSATSAFLAATGITSKTESDAVNNLVINLKSYGLWSKMKAIYPFVSDTNNILSYSQDFTNGIWSKVSATITGDTTTAPDGTLTADSYSETATNTTHFIIQSVNYTVGNNYTFSCYAKAGNQSQFCLIMPFSKFGDWRTAYFNLSNGTVISNNNNSGIAPTITSAGNGWYRCTFTNTCISSGADSTAIGKSFNSGLGDGLTNLYIWGAQVEIGNTATTYQNIATTPANRFVSQFKYNLKDARDLDAAFRLAFNGTWTYSKQGATPNGVNAYANTYLNPVTNSLTSASSHLSYYARTAATTGDPAELANYTSGSEAFVLQSKSSGAANRFFFSAGNAASRTVATAPIGYMAGSAVANTRRDLYLNGVSVANNTTTDTATLGNYNLYLGAGNISGSSVGSYSNAQAAFATIGNGLTSTEIANLYTSVQLFQQELARYVGVPIVSDANAQAFLDAAVITDQTQANAVNTLVTDLKTYGLWTKMKAIYPFVGGTATTHKWNLKDPRDLDAAYRLAFSGAWTHSSTGALPNGANAYADSFLTPSTTLSLNSTHLSYYSRTNNSTNGVEMGSIVTAGAGLYLLYSYSGVSYKALNRPQTSTGSVFTPTNGLLIGNRQSSTTEKYYHKGTLIDTLTVSTTALPPNKIFLGAYNNGIMANEYSTKQTAFASIGDGLSDTEAADLSTAVNKFQTSLSRNV